MNCISTKIRNRIHFVPIEGALRVRLDDSITEYDVDGKCLQSPGSIIDAMRFRYWVEGIIRSLKGDMVGVYSEIVGRLSKHRDVCLLGRHPFLEEFSDILAGDATMLSMGMIPAHWTRGFQSMYGEGIYRG